VDSATQALMRYREGGFVRTPSDEEDDMVPVYPPPKYEYY